MERVIHVKPRISVSGASPLGDFAVVRHQNFILDSHSYRCSLNSTRFFLVEKKVDG